MRKEFAVAAPPRDPRWMLALFMGIPWLIVLGLGISKTGKHPIPLAVAALISAVFLITFLVLCWAAKRRAIALDAGILDVLATFYRRRVAVQDIDLDNSQVIDLREHREWRPLWKINGYAMPGLYAGWFRRRDWSSLFCLVTDRQRVLLLPLRAGGTLLLSAERPAELLDALRAADDVRRGRS